MARARISLRCLLASVAALCLTLAHGPGWAFLTSEVNIALKVVASGTSSPAMSLKRAEALVFMHNKDINLAAIRGDVDPAAYQKAQAAFEARNKAFVEKAAKDAGLIAKTQAPKPGAQPTYNPGTDTDIIVEKPPGAPDITEKQIMATEDAYQKQVRDYLNESGLNPPEGKINTDTDFMPHPRDTTPEEFTKINKGINERGGTAYESPSAAKVEAQMRPPKGQDIPPLDIKDTGAYVTEMQNLANHKIEKAAHLEAQADAIRKTNPAHAQKLDADAQLLRSQASKYIDRIDKVTDVVCKQNGIEPPKKPGMEPPSKPIKDWKPGDSLTQAGESIAGGRGTGSKTGADIVGDMGNLAVNRGVKDYAETLSKIAAKDPAKAAVAQQQIAEQIKHMNPEMREQYINKAKEAYTKAGGTDPEAFGKDLKGKANTAAADYNAKHPPGSHDGPAKPGAPDAPTKPGTPDAPGKPGTPDAPTRPGAPDTPTKPGVPDTPTKPGTPDVPGTGAKIINTVGTIMTIADIGNACDTLEKYLAGEISGKEAAETLVDTTLTLGLIGAGKKVATSAQTWWEINKTIHQANKMNVVAYFTQWEIQLRKAGMSAEEARRLVGQAMISGDASQLEAVAGRMRGEGKDFTVPKLVIDKVEYSLTDYGKEVLEQSWETGKGIVVGAYTGIKYIVLAPSRIVEAWAQGELAEAELEYQSAAQEAWMKGKLFQRLLKAGVPPREALKAINDYFSGADMKKLRDIFRKLRGGYVGAQHSQKDWYCTNRPEIIAPVLLPPILQMMGVPPVPIPLPPVPGQR